MKIIIKNCNELHDDDIIYWQYDIIIQGIRYFSQSFRIKLTTALVNL